MKEIKIPFITLDLFLNRSRSVDGLKFDKAYARYEAYLAEILPRLPSSVRNLAKMSFHDYVFGEVKTENEALIIPVEFYRLTFQNGQLTLSEDEPVEGRAWLFHEIHELGKGMFQCHVITDVSEIDIQFSDVEVFNQSTRQVVTERPPGIDYSTNSSRDSRRKRRKRK